MDIIGINEILSSLSDEAIRAAADKGYENGFNIDRGVLPFSFIAESLRSTRDLLSELIAAKSVDGLPISVVEQIGNHLNECHTAIQQIMSSIDAFPQLAFGVDMLRATLLQYGLVGKGKGTISLEAKQRKLAELTSEIDSLILRTHEILNYSAVINSTMETLNSIELNATSAFTKIDAEYRHSVDFAAQANAALTVARDTSEQINKLHTISNTSRKEIATFETALKKLYSEALSFRTRINDVEQHADAEILEFSERTEAIVAKNEELEKQVMVVLQKAVGASLFNSYQIRKDEVATAKKAWAWRLGIITVIAVVAAITIVILGINSRIPIESLLLLKVGIALPIGYALWFCTVQYGRERRLEEEYAFRANISVSLVPYMDLVADALRVSEGSGHEPFGNFILSSVEKVFTSPVDKAFLIREGKLPTKSFENIAVKLAEATLAFSGKIPVVDDMKK